MHGTRKQGVVPDMVCDDHVVRERDGIFLHENQIFKNKRVSIFIEFAGIELGDDVMNIQYDFRAL